MILFSMHSGVLFGEDSHFDEHFLGKTGRKPPPKRNGFQNPTFFWGNGKFKGGFPKRPTVGH